MSRPRYPWWGYVKSMIRRYPSLCERHEYALSMSTTANYSTEPKGGGDGRGLENTVLRELSRNEEKEREAVEKALRETEETYNGKRKVRMITMVYFKQTHTLEGAIQACHVSSRWGRKWHGDFIRAVARNFGLYE